MSTAVESGTPPSCSKQFKSYFRKVYNLQQLLFHGYLRSEILNCLSNDASKLHCDDVMTVCNAFYTLKLEPLWMKRRAELNEKYDEWMN